MPQKQTDMKIRNFFISFIFLAAMMSCRKESTNNHVPDNPIAKELVYTGSTDALSEGRCGMQVLQTGNYTCFTGGQYFTLIPLGNTPSSNIDVYQTPSGTWTRFGLSVKREYYGAAALNDKLIVAGGYANYKYSDVIDIFDLATGQATTKKLSKARGYLAAAGAGNKILFAGGSIPVVGNFPSNAVDVYNTQTGALTTDTLSLARSALSAGSAGNKIVFAGGVAWNGSQGYYSDRADIYDVQTGTWTQATLSKPVKNLQVISAGNKIFFFGGFHSSGYPENVDVYDVQANRWTVLTLAGNTLYHLMASTNGSYVYFAHGQNYNYTKITAYNVGNGVANTVPLPVPMRASAMTVAANKLLIAPGVISDTVTNKVFVYDTKKGNFDTTQFNLPGKKGNFTAATAGNKILLAGGVWDRTNGMNQREVTNYKTVSVFELKNK